MVAEPGTAEVAFAVDDPHQGLGLGTLLTRQLSTIARAADRHGSWRRREHDVVHLSLALC